MIFIHVKIIDGTLVVLINGRIKMGGGARGWASTVAYVGNDCSSPQETMLLSQIAVEMY